MIIFGHYFIKTEPFYLIKKSEDIAKTPSNSTVVFQFDENSIALCEYCQKNGVSFAIIADSVKDAIFANALEASYIISDKILSPKVQKMADSYMFDAKVLLYGSDESDLEWAAESEIDGIIFEKGIDYGSC